MRAAVAMTPAPVRKSLWVAAYCSHAITPPSSRESRAHAGSRVSDKSMKAVSKKRDLH
jgi:hypothetical protein